MFDFCPPYYWRVKSCLAEADNLVNPDKSALRMADKPQASEAWGPAD
jgi:hypothetical protein